MSALASMTIADGTAVPVNRTFAPVNIDAAGVAKWADRSGGIALGFPVITELVRTPTKDSRSYKVSAKVILPVLELTSPSTASGIQPAPTLAYNLLATIELVLPERSSLLERKHINAFVKNYLANVNWTNAVELFEPIF